MVGEKCLRGVLLIAGEHLNYGEGNHPRLILALFGARLFVMLLLGESVESAEDEATEAFAKLETLLDDGGRENEGEGDVALVGESEAVEVSFDGEEEEERAEVFDRGGRDTLLDSEVVELPQSSGAGALRNGIVQEPFEAEEVVEGECGAFAGGIFLSVLEVRDHIARVGKNAFFAHTLDSRNDGFLSEAEDVGEVVDSRLSLIVLRPADLAGGDE